MPCIVQVGNVLEELSGKEVKVSSDPTCSRILESLIPSISEEHMLPLLAALAQGEEFCLLSSRYFPITPSTCSLVTVLVSQAMTSHMPAMQLCHAV